MRGKAVRWLLCGLLWGTAFFFAREAQEDMAVTHVVLNRPVDALAVETIARQEREEENPMGFCFWGEQPGVLVSCPDTGGTARVTQVFLAGNPGLMGADALAWQSGCLVDEATARSLFGTAACAGQILWWGERPCPVLGTIAAVQPSMVLMAEPNISLDRLILAAPSEEGSILALGCLLRWGLSGTVLDFFLYWSLVHNCLLLAPGMVAVCLIKGGKQYKGKQLVETLALAGLMWLLVSHIVIPQNLIPSQWSDFSFWGRWWEAEKKNLLGIARTPLGSSQLQMAADMVKSITASMAACFVLLLRRGSHADRTDRR